MFAHCSYITRSDLSNIPKITLHGIYTRAAEPRTCIHSEVCVELTKTALGSSDADTVHYPFYSQGFASFKTFDGRGFLVETGSILPYHTRKDIAFGPHDLKTSWFVVKCKDWFFCFEVRTELGRLESGDHRIDVGWIVGYHANRFYVFKELSIIDDYPTAYIQWLKDILPLLHR